MKQEVIKKFMQSLDTTSPSDLAALNEAVKACSNFPGLQSVINKLINDCKGATSTEIFLKEKCGINLDNTDTGAITGLDAGGAKVKTAKSVVPGSGKASYPSGTSFTKRGLKVIVPKKNSLTEVQQTIVQGLYSWWIDSALKLIKDSYGFSFADSDATVKEITLNFVEESDDSLAYVNYESNSLTLNVNTNRFKNISAEDINGSEETAPFYLDRVLAHELTHAIMAAKIDNVQELPFFILEGMAELTHGADDIRYSDIVELVSNPEELAERLNVYNDSYSVLDYSAGYIFLRYLAKQVSEVNDTISAPSDDDDFIENSENATMISALGGNDTIINSGDSVTVDGGAGNDLIDNEGSNVSIVGGAGIDEIYNIGNDVTINSGLGNDRINNSGENVSINGGNGNNVIYNQSTPTIEDGAITWSKTIHNVTVKTGNGKDFISNFYARETKINSGAGNDIVYNRNYGSYATINTGNGNDYVYNGIASDHSKISLGAGNDILINKESDNVTVNGGKGNDLIEVDADSTDVIIEYKIGDGDDTIYGYNLTDTVSLTGGSVTSESVSDGNLILEIGSGSITFIDALTVNVNGTLYGKASKKGTNGNDYIVNIDSNETLKAYKGNDTIANYGENVLINAGNGKNNVSNYGENSTIITGNGNNTIYNDGYGSKIICGTGNDSIYNDWTHSTIEAGEGNDTITSRCRSLLKGNEGNDLIIDNHGEIFSTINGGTGDDTIYAYADWGGYETIEYTTGDGNDIVYGFNSNDTLRIFGKYTSSTVGNDVSIKVDDGSILLKDAAEEELLIISDADTLITGTDGNDTLRSFLNEAIVLGGKGDDYIYTEGNSTSVDGGAGDDTIYGQSYRASISGGDGNDYIYNNAEILDGGCRDSTIDGGNGDDHIYSYSEDSYIYGGAGNDYIYSDDWYVSIDGGLGNDSIYLRDGSAEEFIIYNSGDGNDLIEGFNETSTLQIGDGKDTYSKETFGSDIIVSVGKGKITLVGAATLSAVNILGEEKATLLTVTNETKSPVTVDSAIKIIDASKRTKAVQITGNALANSISGGSKNDTLNGGNGNDTLTGGAGDDLFIFDVGNDVITDYAAGDKISVNADITSSAFKNSDATFKIGKNTLTVKDGKGKGITFIKSDGTEKTIIGGAYLINDSTNSKVTLSAAWREVADASERTTAIKIVGNAQDNSILGGSGKNYLYGKDGDDYIVGGKVADKLYGQNGDDTLLGGKGNDSLWGGEGADTFIYESGDGRDVIFGFDNSDMLEITGTFSTAYKKSTNTVSFKVDSTSKAITLKDFTATTFNVNGDSYVLGLVKK